MTSEGKDIIGSAPVLLVADVVKSAAYYRDILGFDYDRLWGDPPGFCMPHRDGLIVMLQQAQDSAHVRPNHQVLDHTWNVYFWVKDAQALFEEFIGNGATAEYEPHDIEYYGNREFGIRDLDGYILAFGQNIATD